MVMSQIMLSLFDKSLMICAIDYIDFDDSISCLASCKDVILVLALIDWEYLLMIYDMVHLVCLLIKFVHIMDSGGCIG